MRDLTREELADRFVGISQTRLDSICAALAEMREDAELLAGMRLSFVEPLILPAHGDRWIENGGSIV